MVHSRHLIVCLVFCTGCGCDDDLRDGDAWQFADPAADECVGGDCVADVREDPAGDVECSGADCRDDPDAPPPIDVPPVELDCSDSPSPETRVSPPEVDVVRSSMAVGGDGCPRFSWYADGAIHYAYWDGEAWTTEEAFAPAGYGSELFVDSSGVPTLYVTAVDMPGITRLRRENALWREVESTGDRWNWGLEAVSADRLVALTATQQYTGSDLAVNLLTRSGDGWTWSRVVEFDVLNLSPPQLAIDSSGRGFTAIIENKGYSLQDLDTNLWLATSTDETLGDWTAERVDLGPYNVVRRANVYRVGGELHMLARATNHPERGAPQLLHATRRSDGGWDVSRIEDCPDGECVVGATAVDSRGRLHVVRGFEEAEGYRVEHGVYLNGWRYRSIGSHDAVPSAMEIAPTTGRLHLALIRRTAPQTRSLVYVGVPPAE